MRNFVIDCAVEHHFGVHVDSLSYITFMTTLPTRLSLAASPSGDLTGLSELDGGILRHEDRDVSAGASLAIAPLVPSRAILASIATWRHFTVFIADEFAHFRDRLHLHFDAHAGQGFRPPAARNLFR